MPGVEARRVVDMIVDGSGFGCGFWISILNARIALRLRS
jgi:hypothetical protein